MNGRKGLHGAQGRSAGMRGRGVRLGLACLGLMLPGLLLPGAAAMAQDSFRFGEPSVGQVRDGRIQPTRNQGSRDRPGGGDVRSGQGARFSNDASRHVGGRATGPVRRSAIDPDGDGKGFTYRASRSDDRHSGGSHRWDGWDDRGRSWGGSRGSYGSTRPGHWYGDRHDRYDDCDLYGRPSSGLSISFGTSSRTDWYGAGWSDCDDWSDARWRHDPYRSSWGWEPTSAWHDPWAGSGYHSGSQTVVVTEPIYVQEGVVRERVHVAEPVVVVGEVAQEERTVVVVPAAPRQTTVVVSRPSASLVSEGLVRADRGDHVRAATQLREFARAEGRVPAYGELDRGAQRALDRVIRDYERRSTGYEAGADTFFVLGMSYAIRGEYERARAAMDAAHAWGDRDVGTRQIRQWLQRR